MGLDLLSPVHMRPPEPDPLPGGPHKWMAPYIELKLWCPGIAQKKSSYPKPHRAPHHIIQTTASEGFLHCPRVITWWLEWDSNLRPSEPKVPNSEAEAD